MQTETTVRYHFTPVRTVTLYTRKSVGKWEMRTVGQSLNNYYGKQWGGFSKD